MENSKTFLWCIVGFVCFALGGALRMYVLTRTSGLSGLTSRSAVVIASYRKLVSEGRAPLWPLPMSYVFIILGIFIVFGSILVSKS